MFQWETPFGIHVLLHVLGVCPRYERYYCLCRAIHLVMRRGEPMDGQTLYPRIAADFGAARSVVEAALRLAVEECTACGPEDLLEELTGGRPPRELTDIEFINAAALYLLRPPGGEAPKEG